METKKKTKFYKSLRFRILVILIILGIVPGIIVTQLMIHYYENQAVEVSVSAVRTECEILLNSSVAPFLKHWITLPDTSVLPSSTW